MLNHRLLPFFFGLTACSWMPHWACHYYRLETGTSFVVGSWSYSPFESLASLALYGFIALINLAAISQLKLRMSAALISGALHTVIGALHVYRLVSPFTFEVFGYEWPLGASVREALIVLPFGLLSLVIGLKLRRITPATV